MVPKVIVLCYNTHHISNIPLIMMLGLITFDIDILNDKLISKKNSQIGEKL